MSIEILDCLKRKRDIRIKTIIPRQNTAFMWTPALREKGEGILIVGQKKRKSTKLDKDNLKQRKRN